MQSDTRVVVGGAQAIADALDRSGNFAQIFPVETTGELRDVITSQLRDVPKDQLVFLFADTLTVDTPQTSFEMLLQRLTAGGWRVAILAVSPKARDLVATYPQLGLLPGPFTLNTILGALSGLGVLGLDRHDGGDAPLDVRPPFLSQPATQPSAPPVADWTPAPAAAPAPVATPPVSDWAAPAPAADWAPAPVATPPVSDWAAPAPAADWAPAPVATPPVSDWAAPAPASGAPIVAPPPVQTASPATPPAQVPGFATEVPGFTTAPETPAAQAWDSAPPPPPATQSWDAAPPPPASGQSWDAAPPPPASGQSWDAAPPPDPAAWDATPPARAPLGVPAPQGPAIREPSRPDSGWGQPVGAPVIPDDAAPPVRRPLGGQPEQTGGFVSPDQPGGFVTPDQSGGFVTPDQPGGFAVTPRPSPYGATAPGRDPYSGGDYGPDQSGAPLARSAQTGPRRRGFAIAVVAPKGGAGKSSVATNLGVFLGLRLKPYGRTVAILDANVQQADVGKYLNYYTPCITDLVRRPQELTPERISEYMVHPPQFGISALLGPSVVKDADPTYINGALYTTVLGVLRQLYDYVIIDTPVAEKYHDIFSEFVLPQADFLIVAANPNYTTLINIDRWLRDITMSRNAGGSGVDPNRIGILLNKAKEDIDCSEDDVRRELATWNFLGALPYSSAWERANNNFEVVADKNYTELNQSFSQILYSTTGEEGLLADIGPGEVAKPGLFSKLGRALKRGS